MAKVCSKKPLGYVTLPAHPEVIVQCGYCGPGLAATITYEGTPEALINSGIATPEMLSGTYPGRKRVDAAGHHFRLQRSFRTEGGAPHPYCKVAFWKPVDVIDQMPGAGEAIFASARLRRWHAEQADRLTVDDRRAADATTAILARFAREAAP
jgi:hypothetical protein